MYWKTYAYWHTAKRRIATPECRILLQNKHMMDQFAAELKKGAEAIQNK